MGTGDAGDAALEVLQVLGFAADLLIRLDGIEALLSALEFDTGIVPDPRGLDLETAQTRHDTYTLAGSGSERAAIKIGQLSKEIAQLRGLLGQQGPEPEDDTA